jgi:hypothetical protein
VQRDVIQVEQAEGCVPSEATAKRPKRMTDERRRSLDRGNLCREHQSIHVPNRLDLYRSNILKVVIMRRERKLSSWLYLFQNKQV